MQYRFQQRVHWHQHCFRMILEMNALSIAILFGTGGGLGIVISGGIIPLLIDFYGNSVWPMLGHHWRFVCIICPVGLWSVCKLPRSNLVGKDKQKIPFRSMYAIFTGYASFGLGYIVYLTFISAWMVSQQLSALSITSVWVILGLCICISPFFGNRYLRDLMMVRHSL